MRMILIVGAVLSLSLMVVTGGSTGAESAPPAKKGCFTREARAAAERSAKVYEAPDTGYDPVLGYSSSTGPRPGSPPVDESGRARPIACVAAEKPQRITGTLPKFYCTVQGNVDENGRPVRYKVKPQFKGPSPDKRNGEIYGEFLSSRFSKALGFFADDEWVADVTCPDCDKSLSKPFQGAKYTPFQPAAGIEVPVGDGIDVDCDGRDAAPLGESLTRLSSTGNSRAEIDAFKLWLAFIDHGDTKTDNQRFACLRSRATADGSRSCEQPIFYVADMGSTFGFSADSEKKARLASWRGKDPIRVTGGGQCTTTAKSVGSTDVSEAGRQLLAAGLQHLLDAEAQTGLVTRVFKASRNDERDQPAEAWTAEFVRKAKTIIDAKCGR